MIGKGEAAQEYLFGAIVAHGKFGGPRPTGAEVMAPFADAPRHEVPRGKAQSRLAGFVWQWARADTKEIGNGSHSV